MKLSIVTLHTNDIKILETIESVYKTVKTPFEFILVDNNRNKERLNIIKQKFPQLKIIQNPTNYGYARGINVGLQEAKGEFILALNPDILVFDGTIDKMLAYMEAHKDIAVLGPKLLNPDKSLQYSCRRYPSLATLVLRRGPFKNRNKAAVKNYEMHDFDHKEIRDVDWLCGGFLLVPKNVFEQIGLMDEFYFLYFDDVDFCRRAHAVGRVTYFPDVEAIHSASYESKKKVLPFLIHIRSMLYYLLKFQLFPNHVLVKGKGWEKIVALNDAKFSSATVSLMRSTQKTECEDTEKNHNP